MTPQLKDLVLQGKKLPVPLTMTYGEFDIRQVQYEVNKLLFGVFDSSTNFLLFAEISPFDNPFSSDSAYYQIKKIERNKAHHTSDMPAAFLHYLVQDLGLSCISDDIHTHAANNFWQNMQNRGQIYVTVWDAKSLKHYLPSEIGTAYSAVDGVKILHPEDDRKLDRLKSGKEIFRDHFRFYFCARGTGSHLLKEEIQKRTSSVFPNEHLYIMFGEQEYPDYNL